MVCKPDALTMRRLRRLRGLRGLGRGGFRGRIRCIRRARRVRGRRGREAHDVAVRERIGRIVDHALARLQTGDDLHARAEIGAYGHVAQLHLVIGAGHRDLHALRAEDQRARGHEQRVRVAVHREMDLGVLAGEQQALLVVDGELHEHRAGSGRDRLVGVHELGVELHAGALGHRERRVHAGLDRRRVALRHAHVDAQRARVRDREEFGTAAAARVDQRAHVGLARGDHAVERRRQTLERFERFQTAHVRLIRFHGRLLGDQVRGLFIGFLLRDRILLEHFGPALRRGGRELFVRDRVLQIGARLLQLLVEIGRVDHAEQLPGLHVRADIGVPGVQITRDARVDRRVDVGRQMAGQHQHLRSGARFRQHGGDRGHGLRVGPGGEFLMRVHAAEQTAGDDPGGDQQRHGGDGFQMAQRLRRGDVDFSGHGILPRGQGVPNGGMRRRCRCRHRACRCGARG
ncbi:hypothetical protein PT2222_290074 [Paraburkholderia tropica]